MNYKRTGTYCAFNGCGTTNPTLSDMKYYARLIHWNKDKKYELHFSNSHYKTYSVLDSSSEETLKERLMERMRKSKNMILVLSDKSSWNRGMLNFEIEKAVDLYEIPIIATYTMYDYVLNNFDRKKMLEKYWPSALKERIENGTAKVLHIPFKEKVISYAVENYDVHNGLIDDSMLFFKVEKYKEWDLIPKLPLQLNKPLLTPRLPLRKKPTLPLKPPFPRKYF